MLVQYIVHIFVGVRNTPDKGERCKSIIFLNDEHDLCNLTC